VVSTVHSDYRLDYMGRPLSRLTFGNINARALRKLDYRIGVSDAMVDLLISRGFPPDRFFTIYNGIDFTPAPDQGDRLPYLRSLGLDADEDSVVVGIAARHEPRQGHVHPDPRLCRRLRRVPPPAAGDRRRRRGAGQKLEALARELGVGRQGVLRRLDLRRAWTGFYSALDINALTSLSETFPYALTEGARFHLATVATAVGGIPYLIDTGRQRLSLSPRRLGGPGRRSGRSGRRRRAAPGHGGKALPQGVGVASFPFQRTVDTQLEIYGGDPPPLPAAPAGSGTAW
jgi:glycosyltransferase involved in cell wall biosynthesis